MNYDSVTVPDSEKFVHERASILTTDEIALAAVTAELSRLNANLEALLAVAHGQLLAQLVDILRDLREIAAGTLGYDISGDD